jgi:3-oxoacyl-[acyl-carrier protein] reductase
MTEPGGTDGAGGRRVALVTGSARGLGRVIAERLARTGFAVAVNDLRRPDGTDDVDAVAAAIRDGGGTAAGFVADVTDEAQVDGLVASIAATLGPVEVLVVNATGPQPDIALADTTWRDHLDQLEFFVKSPVLLGRAVLPAMRERGWGRIVHVDSEVADRPPPHRSAYATAKAAQVGLALCWARELAAEGITVNTVAPGFVPVERHADVAAEVLTAYVASTPAGHFGSPDDIAAAVAFFASDAAAYVTGQRLVLDGARRLG